MKTRLAKVLKKYWKQIGNQIIFINSRDGPVDANGTVGYNLNKLAVNMYAMFRERHLGRLDPDIISSVIDGELLFTPIQLDVFCELLELTSEEHKELQNAYAQDISQENIVEVSVPPRDFLEQIERNRNTIIQVRSQGNSPLSKSLASKEVDNIIEVLRVITSESFRIALLGELGLMLFEMGMAGREFEQRNAVLAATIPLTLQIDRLYAWSKDTRLPGLSVYSIGDAYYIKGTSDIDYVTALAHFTQSLENLQNQDDQLNAQRGRLLSLAYTKRKKEFKNLAGKILTLIFDGKITSRYQVATLLEGIARGYGLVGDSQKGFRFLEDASRLYAKMEVDGERAPFLLIQQNRTKLELMVADTPIDKRALELEGVKAHNVATQGQYLRHAQDIKSLLEKYL